MKAVEKGGVLVGDVFGAAPDVSPGVLCIGHRNAVEDNILHTVCIVLSVDADGTGVLRVGLAGGVPNTDKSQSLDEHVVSTGCFCRPGVEYEFSIGSVADFLKGDARARGGKTVNGEMGLPEMDVGQLCAIASLTGMALRHRRYRER